MLFWITTPKDWGQCWALTGVNYLYPLLERNWLNSINLFFWFGSSPETNCFDLALFYLHIDVLKVLKRICLQAKYYLTSTSSKKISLICLLLLLSVATQWKLWPKFVWKGLSNLRKDPKWVVCMSHTNDKHWKEGSNILFIWNPFISLSFAFQKLGWEFLGCDQNGYGKWKLLWFWEVEMHILQGKSDL